MVKHLAILVATVALLGSTAEAGHRRHRCCQPYPSACAPVSACASTVACGAGGCGYASSGCGAIAAGAGCGPQMIEQTVMEPVMTTEIRKVASTEYRQESRERKFMVQKLVPRTEARTRTVAYTENETRTRDEKYTVSTQVTDMVDQTYTVAVPYTEVRKGNTHGDEERHERRGFQLHRQRSLHGNA